MKGIDARNSVVVLRIIVQKPLYTSATEFYKNKVTI